MHLMHLMDLMDLVHRIRARGIPILMGDGRVTRLVHMFRFRRLWNQRN